jgi:hypothetical protein
MDQPGSAPKCHGSGTLVFRLNIAFGEPLKKMSKLIFEKDRTLVIIVIKQIKITSCLIFSVMAAAIKGKNN